MEVAILRRIFIAGMVGFLAGFTGFSAIPAFWPDEDLPFRLGYLVWYTSLGVLIGIAGQSIALPFALRGALVGAWLNLVIALLLHDRLTRMMLELFEEPTVLRSPYWLVLEGAVLGLIADTLATRLAGDVRSRSPLDPVRS